MEVLRKYGAAATILFPLIDAGAEDFESTPVTFASGDTQISKDEGAFANTTNNPAHEGNGIYSLALTATEMQAARIAITIIDSATKAWEDQAVIIATYGNASGQHAFDLDTATQSVNVTQVEGSDATDQIRDAVVDDATRIDASALNTLSSHDPGSQLAAQSDVTGLNDPTAAAIADAVWDEAKSGHVGAGSFGEEVQAHALSSEISALNDPSLADIADAVLDEALSGHVGAGSLGKAIADIETDTGNIETDTQDIQSRLPAALVGGAMDADVSNIQSGAIDADAIAADAIGSSELAASAVDEIVDQVWDEAIAGHAGAGSTGEALSNASAPTAAEVADAVWDEAKSGHVGAGSFGEEVQAHALSSEVSAVETDTQDIQSRLPAALVGGAMDADVSNVQSGAIDADAIAANAIGASELATDAVDEIVDQVWDEAIAGHAGAGSTGEALSSASAPTAAQVADAVWDEAVAGHSGAGSAGKALADIETDAAAIEVDTQDIQSRLPAALVGGAMDADVSNIQSGAVDADAIGADAIGSSELATSAVDEIADQVWDEAIADHAGAGSTGEALSNASAPTAAEVADAVWDEAKSGHVGAGSFGEEVQSHALTSEVAAVETDTQDIQSRLPAALVGGRIDASVGAMAADVLTAAATAADFGTEIATAVWAAGTRTLSSFGTLVADTADQVWDELIAGHAGAGSAGEALSNAGSGASAADIADAVWDEAQADHTSAGTFGEIASEIAAMATTIWGHTTRTLTQAAAAVVSAVSGSTLTITKYADFSASLTGLGSLAGRTDLFFTVKTSPDDDVDTAAIIQMDENNGLLYLNGAAATAGDGSLTVDDEDAGDVTITLQATTTDDLPTVSGLSYDIKMDDTILTSGTVNVQTTPTRT